MNEPLYQARETLPGRWVVFNTLTGLSAHQSEKRAEAERRARDLNARAAECRRNLGRTTMSTEQARKLLGGAGMVTATKQRITGFHFWNLPGGFVLSAAAICRGQTVSWYLRLPGSGEAHFLWCHDRVLNRKEGDRELALALLRLARAYRKKTSISTAHPHDARTPEYGEER